MLNFIFNRQQMADREKEEEGFEQGFYVLPDPKVRASMSPEKLAILLSQQQVGTPAYILVEHELNLRIAQIQALATYKASYIGLIGALAGAVLGAVGTVLLTARLQDAVVKDQTETTQTVSKRDIKGSAEVGGNVNTPAGPESKVLRVQPALK